MGLTRHILVDAVEAGARRRTPDEVIVEEPLEIRLDGERVATTMRTPGDDHELAVGLCHAEGLLDGVRVRTVRHCGEASAGTYNVVDVSTDGSGPRPVARLGTISSSCGLCGATALDSLRERLRPLVRPEPPDLDTLLRALSAMRDQQDLFDRTGAVHAAATVDADGRAVVVREDIGRHNAVDKVVGRLLLDDRLPAAGHGLLVSGRASFEIVQKAWAAGFPAVLAVSAPSALAVEAARVAGMTLAGFVRDDRVNVYAG